MGEELELDEKSSSKILKKNLATMGAAASKENTQTGKSLPDKELTKS